MAIKRYAIINSTTNLVLMCVEHQENNINTDYSGFTVAEIPPPSIGVIDIAPGMLYQQNIFWVNPATLCFAQSGSVITYAEFRGRLPIDTLVRIDNYKDEIGMTQIDKSAMKTYLSSIEGRSMVNLEDSKVRDFTSHLVKVGIITADEKAALLAAVP